MHWVAPTEKDTTNETLEKRLWAAADQFRANSGLKAGQYSTPVLSLIFLRFEPFHGRMLDPACGSGGMFVQSARDLHGTGTLDQDCVRVSRKLADRNRRGINSTDGIPIDRAAYDACINARGYRPKR